jgi:hypothetical protein
MIIVFFVVAAFGIGCGLYWLWRYREQPSDKTKFRAILTERETTQQIPYPPK